MTQYGKKILMVCEGQTEVEYLKAWAEKQKVLHLVKFFGTPKTTPSGLLCEGVKEYLWQQQTSIDPVKEVWLVFDRDSHVCFHQVLEQAKRFPFVKLCWSNPCIEAWFLMHFKDIPNYARTKEVVIASEKTSDPTNPLRRRLVQEIELITAPCVVQEDLKRQWKEYKKTGLNYWSTLASKMDMAVRRNAKNNLHDDHYAFGSLMPELLTTMAGLQTNDLTKAELAVGDAWHEICEKRRNEESLKANAPGQHTEDMQSLSLMFADMPEEIEASRLTQTQASNRLYVPETDDVAQIAFELEGLERLSESLIEQTAELNAASEQKVA